MLGDATGRPRAHESAQPLLFGGWRSAPSAPVARRATGATHRPEPWLGMVALVATSRASSPSQDQRSTTSTNVPWWPLCWRLVLEDVHGVLQWFSASTVGQTTRCLCPAPKVPLPHHFGQSIVPYVACEWRKSRRKTRRGWAAAGRGARRGPAVFS